MEAYRFRSMDYLLGDEYQELEKQAIYFASPDQLNDPMEGIRDIVWRGDKIVWTNFFKHYVYCLVVCYFLYTLTKSSDEFDVNKIPIPDRWDLPPNPHIKQLFNNIWHQFRNLPDIPKIIKELEDIDCEIGYAAIEGLLFAIQSIFIKEHTELYFQHGILPDSEMQELTEGLLSALWSKNYWDNFHREITSKTKYWEHEREWRLVLEDRWLDEGEDPKLIYDFNSLKGIIFGIRSSDEEILKAIKIIQKKCEKHERTDFKFYKAEYSQKTGEIRKNEILLPKALQNVR